MCINVSKHAVSVILCLNVGNVYFLGMMTSHSFFHHQSIQTPTTFSLPISPSLVATASRSGPLSHYPSHDMDWVPSPPPFCLASPGGTHTLVAAPATEAIIPVQPAASPAVVAARPASWGLVWSHLHRPSHPAARTWRNASPKRCSSK